MARRRRPNRSTAQYPAPVGKLRGKGQYPDPSGRGNKSKPQYPGGLGSCVENPSAPGTSRRRGSSVTEQ